MGGCCLCALPRLPLVVSDLPPPALLSSHALLEAPLQSSILSHTDSVHSPQHTCFPLLSVHVPLFLIPLAVEVSLLLTPHFASFHFFFFSGYPLSQGSLKIILISPWLLLTAMQSSPSFSPSSSQLSTSRGAEADHVCAAYHRPPLHLDSHLTRNTPTSYDLHYIAIAFDPLLSQGGVAACHPQSRRTHASSCGRRHCRHNGLYAYLARP